MYETLFLGWKPTPSTYVVYKKTADSAHCDVTYLIVMRIEVILNIRFGS